MADVPPAFASLSWASLGVRALVTSPPSSPKRRHGPTPKSSDEKRKHSISCRLTDAELATIDARRGKVRRGEWLRIAALSKPPRIVPELNRLAWVDLARSASNLNQLTHAINSGSTPSCDLAHVIADLRRDLDALRLLLIGGLTDESQG